jgi:hypothetical protein
MMSLQKKTVLFCDGEVFSLDRGLLMGASIWNQGKLQISYMIRVYQAKKNSRTLVLILPLLILRP